MQGAVFCPNCNKDVHSFIEHDFPDGAGIGQMRPVRKCAECRLPLPKAASTAPDTSMPAAATLAPEHPAPVPAQQRRVVAPRRIQPAPVQAAAASLLVPSHDYAAMMRDELAALDDAERQIRERRVYLQRMIAMLEPQATEAPDEAA